MQHALFGATQKVVHVLGKICFKPHPLDFDPSAQKGVINTKCRRKEDIQAASEMRQKASRILQQLLANGNQSFQRTDGFSLNGRALIPGDWVVRKNAFVLHGFEHDAIYIGDGHVIEVHGRPSKPRKLGDPVTAFKIMLPRVFGLQAGVVLVPLKHYNLR